VKIHPFSLPEKVEDRIEKSIGRHLNQQIPLPIDFIQNQRSLPERDSAFAQRNCAHLPEQLALLSA
jgi:hypothetical protein